MKKNSLQNIFIPWPAGNSAGVEVRLYYPVSVSADEKKRKHTDVVKKNFISHISMVNYE